MSNTTNVPPQGNNPSAFSDPLLNRFFLSPQEKKDTEKGKAIVKAFYDLQTSNDSLSYFKNRQLRQAELLLWSKGMQSMKEFLDYMSVSDATKAFVNIDLTQQRIAAQFVGTLVESMSKNRVYPCVKAIDDGSMSEKEQRQLEAIFRMKEVGTIDDLQKTTGVQLEPDNVFIPDDELSAKVYFGLQDRLPKEIRFETMLNKVMNDIHFERVLNRKSIFDLTVLNTGATKIERIGAGQYTVRRCLPNNLIYNFFLSDTGEQEVSMIGEFYNLKVKDFRSKFGKSKDRPEGLSEQEIFEIAKLSSTKNNSQFNFTWNDNYNFANINIRRPYDDYSILILDCEINFDEDTYFVSKKDAFGRSDVQIKKSIPGVQYKKDGTEIQQPLSEGTEIIKRPKNTWMRGVYAPHGDKLLYWGSPDIIITPYTDVSKPLSSYSINIPNNDGEYVPSLFERGLEPLREYTITKLKRKQLIAQVRPSGIRIDVESARNIDLGNGDSIAWEEVLRIYNQTGTELWSSKGVDPLQREAPPISQTTQDTTIQKIIELTNVLEGIRQELRLLWGVPQYRDGSDVGDRTSGVLQEQQNQSSFNVTDFITNANNQLWEETFYKLCLLHWNDIVREEPESRDDMLNTRFDLQLRMKSTEYEKQLLEQDIQRYSQVPDAQGNPSITLKDAMMLREIDDHKLAMWYLAHTFENNRRKAMEESQKQQEQNAQVQAAAAQQAAEAQKEMQADKMKSDKDMKEFETTKQKELIVLQGIFNIAAKGEDAQFPKDFVPIVKQLIPNILIPLAKENEDIKDQTKVEMQMEAMQQLAQAAQAQQGQQDGQQMGQQSPDDQQQQVQQPQMMQDAVPQ